MSKNQQKKFTIFSKKIKKIDQKLATFVVKGPRTTFLPPELLPSEAKPPIPVQTPQTLNMANFPFFRPKLLEFGRRRRPSPTLDLLIRFRSLDFEFEIFWEFCVEEV